MDRSQLIKVICAPSDVRVNNDVYFYESYGNRIFKYSLEREELICLACSSRLSGDRLGYMGVAQCEGKIYFFPYYANEICVYDIRRKNVEYKECSYRHITCAVSCEKKIFYWADDQKVIFCFDVDQDVQKEVKLPNEIHTNAGCGGCVVFRGSLYLPAEEKGTIICVDTLTLDVGLLVIPNENMSFKTIDFDGENFWLSGTEKKIVKWNLEKEVLMEYSLKHLEERKTAMTWDFYFYSSKIFKDYIYFSPFKAKQLIRIHIHSGRMEEILEMRENEITMLLENWNEYIYFCCKNLKSGMAIMDCLINEMGDVCKEKIMFGEVNCNLPFYEHNKDSLQDFILQIKGEENEKQYFQ